jgi:hypothetical protein
MATFSITHHQRLDDVAVIQTLTPTDIAVGQSVTVSGLGHNLNGTHTVIAVPQYLFLGLSSEGDFTYNTDDIIPNQLAFQDAGDVLERSAAEPFGTLTWTLAPTWTSSALVVEFLGISAATANDTAFIATCVNAANAYCYRKRVEAGYRQDSTSSSPSNDVTLGTTLYAAALYRERGSIDSFQTFEAMPAAGQFVNMGRIHQLLGVNRSQVA